jgi:hypothetical protein
MTLNLASKWILTILGLLVAISQVAADDEANASTASLAENVGFMRDVPEALKVQFPMCEAFLGVEWINKKQGIGFTTYQALMKSKDGTSIVQKKKMSALVDLDTLKFDFDVSDYEAQGRLPEIFEAVQNGTINVSLEMQITYKGKVIRLNGANVQNYNATQPLLSDHRKTVCVVYPDEHRAWLVEVRTLEHAYSQSQREAAFEKIRQINGGISKRRFERLKVLDLNFDGGDDYFDDRSFIYSWSDRLYETSAVLGPGARYYNFSFPPTDRICRLGSAGMQHLWTDGRNFYARYDGEDCNLTKLTSKN